MRFEIYDSTFFSDGKDKLDLSTSAPLLQLTNHQIRRIFFKMFDEFGRVSKRIIKLNN